MYKATFAALALAALLIPAAASARVERADLDLACAPDFQVVQYGEMAYFTAITNVNGPFEWVTPDFGVIDAGTVFGVPMTWPGSQQIDVVWGSQRATCQVEVVGYPGYDSGYQYGSGQGYGIGPNVTLSSVLYPYLPNTGFEPQTMAAFAFAVVLLLGSGIALYPHVRKAFIVVTR